MKQITAVFRNQLALFLRDKGMLVFYALAVLVIGIGVPLFSRDLTASLSFAALLTCTFLIPILSDSMAGEREKKTLESLLSTPVKGSRVVWGKALFAWMFGVVFFVLAANLARTTLDILGAEIGHGSLYWLYAVVLAILNFAAVALGGLYQSALSGDTRIAYSRIALLAFPMGIVYIAALTSLNVVAQEYSAYVLGIFAAFYLLASVLFAVRIVRLRQSTYFQNVKYKKSGHKQNLRTDDPRSKSQLSIVFAHEMRYLATLKFLLLNFALMCFFPVLLCITLYLHFGEIDLTYAVLLTALMMPRTPTNLIAYSIGGEKTYKTAESLLSTPLGVRPMFVAKMLVPVLVSAGMLVLSSVITLVGVNLIGVFAQDGKSYMYTADQLVLLLPVGILSCVSMVLITGVLSARLKKPRNGLYVSSILGFLFVLPPLAIVYLTVNHLLWSLVYCVVLAIANTACLVRISGNVSRPQLMSWI